ncbi:LytR/AlgR family response regulator transcription factor [Pedobacter sp. GR22-10]|uniref:LytR/AlgR family response regulator transcription factor n=1 Tax=Pedobacter sp. GR22-10 TaxID=2994472 RepID=UPI0022483155|nr:LytTR family DNA-binding domain-containing protein [Pedobacter sp. GR22-10]MCX2429858.1 LytTR family DNA-binding domain-containing protein [Pedobacter sp. GR22-10]
MINCVIVDDEQHSIDNLVAHVSQISNLNIVIATTNTTEILEIIASQDIQLAFLDVQMPGISGLEMAEVINGKCKIILTTAYEQYALKGYDLNIVDFLLKPISYPRLLKAVHKVTTLISLSSSQVPVKMEEDFIYVKTEMKSKLVKILLSEIEYIESIKNCVTIYHNGTATPVYISLKELEGELPQSKFLRVHKSFIIPLPNIDRVEGNQIILRNLKMSIQLGETYRALFWDKINSKTIGK